MFHCFSFVHHSRWIAVALAFVPVTFGLGNAQAQTQAVGTVQQDHQTTQRASESRTPVPPTSYRSVFADLPQGVETTALDWRAANANVGQFKRGHMDVLKWEQSQATKAQTAPADTKPPSHTVTTP